MRGVAPRHSGEFLPPAPLIGRGQPIEPNLNKSNREFLPPVPQTGEEQPTRISPDTNSTTRGRKECRKPQALQQAALRLDHNPAGILGRRRTFTRPLGPSSDRRNLPILLRARRMPPREKNLPMRQRPRLDRRMRAPEEECRPLKAFCVWRSAYCCRVHSDGCSTHDKESATATSAGYGTGANLEEGPATTSNTKAVPQIKSPAACLQG